MTGELPERARQPAGWRRIGDLIRVQTSLGTMTGPGGVFIPRGGVITGPGGQDSIAARLLPGEHVHDQHGRRMYMTMTDPDTAYPDDAAIEEAGYAAGIAVWDVLEDVYGDVLGDGDLARAQLESLKRAILAQARGEQPVPGDAAGAIEASATFRQAFTAGHPLGSPHPAAAEFARLAAEASRPEEPVLGRHEDERGIIQDLLGAVSAVTEITTRAGSVRGNHVHKLTTQWTYVVSGMLRTAWMSEHGDGVHTAIYGPGVLIEEPAGIPHAWQAIEDTTVLVFTKGPRSGEAYESDTTRLEVPLLT